MHGFLISLQILHILSLYLAIASAVALAEVNISYPACRELTKYNFVVAFIWAIRFPPVYSQSLLTFELFSVMVHSGSAAGGHYYACIKSFSDGQWYSFNDQHVSKVSLDPWVNVTQNDSPDYVSACHHSLDCILFINTVVLCFESLSVHFCAFLLGRSPKMISRRHMVDPQGAEAITPVPLQGQLCLISVTGLTCITFSLTVGLGSAILYNNNMCNFKRKVKMVLYSLFIVMRLRGR